MNVMMSDGLLARDKRMQSQSTLTMDALYGDNNLQSITHLRHELVASRMHPAQQRHWHMPQAGKRIQRLRRLKHPKRPQRGGQLPVERLQDGVARVVAAHGDAGEGHDGVLGNGGAAGELGDQGGEEGGVGGVEVGGCPEEGGDVAGGIGMGVSSDL